MTKMTDEQHQIDNDEISLKELIQKIKDWVAYLKTKWKIIFLAGVLGAAIGLYYAYKQPITYKAVLTFALEEDKGSGGGGFGGLASSFGIDLGSSGGGAFAGSNLMELMKSRLLVEKTLLNPVLVNGDTISLAEYYIQINELREKWSEKPGLKNVQFLPKAERSNFTLQQDSILQTIFKSLTDLKSLTISQKDKKVSITDIEVLSENEKFAKVFCENLAKETSEFYIETKSKKSRLNTEILQKQTDSIRAELNNAITGVAAASDNVYNLNPALNIKSSPGKRRQVDVQANTAILTQLVAQLEMSKVTLRKETPLIQVIDRPIFPLEKQKVGKLKSLLLGGFLAGFLTVLYLIFSNLYKKIIA
jgi:uncharacterized protein involved in exopolysaccharide biosynthesis